MPTFELSILLIIENPLHRALISRELRRLGCEVFCARDLDEAADVVRAGVPATLLLVRLGEPSLSDRQLQREMARRLPGWGVETSRHLAAYATSDNDKRVSMLN
jgi:CheY-like chemotaxis protein